MRCRTGRVAAAGAWVLIAAAWLAGGSGAATAQTAEQRPEWNRPVAPFRIFGPLFYVGTVELGVYAIDTGAGLIVLDGGLPESAPGVVASLEQLGHSIGDVEILLNSHSHFDHAGGLAELKRLSGAQMVASRGDRAQLEAGGAGDFAWGSDYLFPPVAVDREVADGETVTLGGVTLTAHVTAGHTRGCTTWTTTLEEEGVRRFATFFCSTSVPDPENYRLADNPRYPAIATDYEKSFATLRALPTELFLGAHASFVGLEAKRPRRLAGEWDAFVDPDGFRSHLDRSEARFRELLAAAREKVPAAP